MRPTRNKKAWRLLKSVFWGAGGWKDDRPSPSGAELETLAAANMWFDDVELSHDALVARVVAARENTSRALVIRGFIYSLSSRLLEYRSALASWTTLDGFEAHDFERGTDGDCAICGWGERAQWQDFNVLNFERHMWGGVRHLQEQYATFDLERFSELPPPSLVPDDVEHLRRLLETLGSLEPSWPITKINKAISSAVLPSNQSEREVLTEILSQVGVLRSLERSSRSPLIVADAVKAWFGDFVQVADIETCLACGGQLQTDRDDKSLRYLCLSCGGMFDPSAFYLAN